VNQAVISLIRTICPIIAGALITWLVRQGIRVDASVSQPLTEALVAVFSAAYYALARLLETKVAPGFGWMLGVPKTPAYPAAKS
jgi:hypothetical protein